jgi:hypothetical protein
MSDTATSPDPWVALEAELDAWATAKREALLWWRDDDATEPTDQLTRLLDMASSTPISIAAVPASATEGLAEMLARYSAVSALPHGYSHQNHAPSMEKKSEFGLHRRLEDMVAEIDRGWRRLNTLMPHAATAVFVPPWNRIDSSVAEQLERIGLRAVSVFGPTAPDKRFKQLNVHVDIIDWQRSRNFVGDELAIAAFINHLTSQRLADVIKSEVTGLMTHHLNHDPASWRFIERLLEVTHKHPASRWISVKDLLENVR